MIFTLTLSPSVDEIVQATGQGDVKDVVGRYRVPAGKGINVAGVLASLAVRSTALGFVGRTEAKWFGRQLSAIGVRPRLTTVAAQTRTNTTVLLASGGEMHLKEKAGAVTRAEFGKLREAIGKSVRRGSWVAFCGSLPPGMRIEDYGELCRLCRELGANVLVDSGPPGLAVAARCGVAALKGNEEEIAGALGLAKLGPPAAAVGRLGSASARIGVVTLGPRGAALRDGETVFRGGCPTDRVRSTVGAGDAFTAGLLWGLEMGEEGSDLLVRALAVAAAKIVEERPGMIRMREFRAARRRVSVREVGDR